MNLERPHGRPLRVSTKIPVAGATRAQTAENKRLAEAVYNARMGDLARGRADLPLLHDRTFKEQADWFERHKLPERRGAEREREILPGLRAAFGSVALSAIDAMAVDERWVRRRRADGVSPRTINREIDFLKSILQSAVPRFLKASPLYGVRRLRVVKPKRRLMTLAEEDRLLTHLAPADKAILLLGLDGLCRLSDILRLRREDDHGRTLYISDPKNPTQGEPYTVPVSKRLRQALDAVPNTGPYFFEHRRRAKTERDRRKGIRQMLQTACRKAHVKYGRAARGLTFHWATRRTGATRMIRAHVDPKTVQRLGNWASASLVLEIYAEAEGAALKRAVEVPGTRPVHTARKRSKKRSTRAA